MVERNTPIPVTCLDKPRSLLFTLNAAAKIKQATGDNPLSWNKDGWADLANSAIGEAEPKRFLAVLHALLAHEDQSLTVVQVGDMVSSLPQMRELFGAMALAYTQFVGPAPEVSEDPTKAQDPIPTSSGQSADLTLA